MDKRSKERREDKIPRKGKEMQGDLIFKSEGMNFYSEFQWLFQADGEMF